MRWNSVAMACLIAWFLLWSQAARSAPQGHESRTFDFTYEVSLNSIPRNARQVRIWLPLASSDTHQTVHRLVSVARCQRQPDAYLAGITRDAIQADLIGEIERARFVTLRRASGGLAPQQKPRNQASHRNRVPTHSHLGFRSRRYCSPQTRSLKETFRPRYRQWIFHCRDPHSQRPIIQSFLRRTSHLRQPTRASFCPSARWNLRQKQFAVEASDSQVSR